ncbi:MAG: ABC transporter permease [Anaerolineaceae bacterium]|nr:ABC transporter permease [Anaerolineaceae bacterium]
MSSSAWRLIGRQMEVQIRVRALNWTSLLLLVLQPAIFTAVGMLLARAAGQMVPDLIYTVIGGGVMGMWSGLVFTSTFDITRDRRDGTLELIIGSPTSLHTVEAIRTLTNVLMGLVSMAVAFVAAMLLFRYSLAGVNTWAVLVSLVVILFAMWCSGLFLANFLAWSRLFSSFVDFLEIPVAVLCGFMYPIRVLPEWMQHLAALLPLRWAVEGLNAALMGEQDLHLLLRSWGIALGLAWLVWAGARWLEGKVHDHIRITGELNSI